MSMEGDFSQPTNINMIGHVGTVEYNGGDANQTVIFYVRPVRDAKASIEAGCPQMKNMNYIKIYPPGERGLNVIDRPANQSDLRRWPRQWAQFQQSAEQVPEGASVEFLYPENPAVAATLKANGVFVIEQLANLSGNAIEALGMGSQRWVNDAQKWLTNAKKSVSAAQHRRDMELRDRENTTLKRQVEELAAEVRILRSKEGRKGPEPDDFDARVAEAVQRLQGRPTHGAALPPVDPQLAVINATSATAEASRNAKRKPARRGAR